MSVIALFRRRRPSPVMEDLAMRDRRIRRERFWREARAMALWTFTHAFAFALGCVTVYFGVAAPLVQRLAHQKPQLVRAEPAVDDVPGFKCTKDEGFKIVEAFARGDLNKHQVAEYVELCRAHRRAEQVKPSKE